MAQYNGGSADTLADQMGTLNSNLNNLRYSSYFTGVSSLDVLKTELQNIANSMNVDEIRPIRIYCNFSSDGFVVNLRYFGNLSVFQKSGSTATIYSILFVGEQGKTVSVNNHEGTWTVKELATVS